MDLVAQLRRREGLGEICRRAARGVPVDLILLDRCGDEHDLGVGHLSARADRVGELETIHLRHRDVGEDGVGPHAEHELEPLPTVVREMHLVW